jgi:hypothetical protein
LVSRGSKDLFPLAILQKVVRECSNHNPLIHSEKVKPSTSFRYELNWEKGGGFHHRFKKAWCIPVRGKDANSIFILRLKMLKRLWRVGEQI